MWANGMNNVWANSALIGDQHSGRQYVRWVTYKWGIYDWASLCNEL